MKPDMWILNISILSHYLKEDGILLAFLYKYDDGGDGCSAQGVTACCVYAYAGTEVVCMEICLYNHL